MKIYPNPFKFGSIVSGDYFYNREEVLERVKHTLTGGNNIALYAPRRYGKSSLVKKALDELSEQSFTCVYVDMMRVYSRETFVQTYAKAIAEQHHNRLKELAQTVGQLVRGIVPSLSFDALGQPNFSLAWVRGGDKEQTIEDIINLPAKLSSKQHRWIVAFDEFQEVTKLNGDSFENILRSCIQQHDNVSYVFLGSQTHLLKDMFNTKSRAFYQSALSMTLPKIEAEKSIQFLIDKFEATELHLDKTLASYIVEMAEGIAYYIQFIAFELWQLLKLTKQNSVSKNIINQAIENVISMKTDYYWELMHKQTPYRRKVLEALLYTSTEIYAKHTAETFALSSGSNTQSALKYLIHDGVIEKINNEYVFSDPFLKHFMRKNIVGKKNIFS